MFPHAQRFDKWLRRRSPHATTPIHYTNDLKLFFAWAGKPPTAITLHDVDAYIPTGGLCSDHCRQLGHAMTTVNRRLAALRMFYHFLHTETDAAPPNPVLPRRHFIRQPTQGAIASKPVQPGRQRLPERTPNKYFGYLPVSWYTLGSTSIGPNR